MSALCGRWKVAIDGAHHLSWLRATDTRDDPARRLWRDAYHRLAQLQPAIVGQIGARAERTIRFALSYTLLEGARQIQPQARSLDGSPAAIVSRQCHLARHPDSAQTDQDERDLRDDQEP